MPRIVTEATGSRQPFRRSDEVDHTISDKVISLLHGAAGEFFLQGCVRMPKAQIDS